jgi:hypothetical protein
MNSITKTFFLLSLALVVYPAISQNSILNNTSLKKGIYRNIDQFKANSPSYEGKFKPKKVLIGYGLLGFKHDTLYRCKMNKKKARKLGAVYGFCDGKNVYLNFRHELLYKKTQFCKLDNLGRYCCFNLVIIREIFNPFTMLGVPVVSDIHQKGVLTEMIMDFNTGIIYILDNAKLEEIIKDDPALYREYMNDSSPEKNLRSYIIEYSEKHKNEIK